MITSIKTSGASTMRFVFYLMLILLLVIGTTNYWLYQASTQQIESSLDQVAESKLGGLVSLSGYYISHFENQLLAKMGKDIGAQEGVKYLSIQSGDGGVDFHSGKIDSSHMRIYSRDILSEGTVVGQVKLGLDTVQMEVELTQAGKMAAGLATLSILVLGGVLFFIFRTQVDAAMARAKREQELLREEQDFFTAVMNTSEHKVLVLDPTGCVALANRSCAELCGQNEANLVGAPIWEHIELVLGDRSLTELCMNAAGVLDAYAVEQLTKQKAHTLLPRLNDRDRRIEWSFNTLADATGNLRYIIGAGSDITEQYYEAQHLEHMAHHDALTGLPNRALLADRLHEAAKRHRRDKTPFALLYIDLDKFKPINDSLGHEAGDYVLKLIATRIQDILREVDTVARLGGDEFAVILHNVATRENACIAANKVLAAIIPPFAYHSNDLQVGASIGITLCPDDGTDLDQLMKYADSAMYQAKQGGRNCYRMFDLSSFMDYKNVPIASQ